jgi:hypothetical protein
MQIHNFLRSRRLRAGIMSYDAAVRRAEELGYTTSVQHLNRGERVSAYLTPATREMYVHTYRLPDADIAALDVLSAQCLIMRGSNTNPWMRVVDTRQFNANVEHATHLVTHLLKDRLKEEELRILASSIKGILCDTLTPTAKTDS